MSETLKPCPFCGSPAELETDNDHHGEWFNLGCSRHWGSVPDPDDGCPGGRLWYTEDPEGMARAIAAWNRRAPDADSAALRAWVERLEAVLRKVERATSTYVEVTAEYFSDTEYDRNGCLAEADAELSVNALPAARAALTEGDRP